MNPPAHFHNTNTEERLALIEDAGGESRGEKDSGRYPAADPAEGTIDPRVLAIAERLLAMSESTRRDLATLLNLTDRADVPGPIPRREPQP